MMTANVFTYVDYGDIKAKVDLERCDGCAFCVDVCPFDAISLVHSTPMVRHIVIDENRCQGCGLCQGTCPKEGVHIDGFSMKELSSMIGDLLRD